MSAETLLNELESQRRCFSTGATFSFDFRKEMLERLRRSIVTHEPEMLKALAADLGKPEFESYAGDIGILYKELRYVQSHLRSWMKPKRVWTPLVHFPAWSRHIAEPKGVVLIIAPWNYPFQLLFMPLIGAIAAGNCAMVKPSELAPHSASVIEKIIRAAFPAEFVSVAQGIGGEVVPPMMKNFRFDHVFFTGSIPTGKAIAALAAEQLVPVTLELGGKSPCIVDRTADLKIAAKRILWGKCFNAGQSCIAPDYLLVHRSVKGAFIEEMKRQSEQMFGPDASISPDYARIINVKHFDRIVSYLNGNTILFGGRYDRERLYIEPTLIDEPSANSNVMREEIFGPVLPVIGFDTEEEAAKIIANNPHPLALYYFGTDRDQETFFTGKISFGGGGVNATLAHLATSHLPFGGIGQSGMGACHGKYSFDTFSHVKGITSMPNTLDLPVRYAAYRGKSWILRLLMRP